jgi:hypothetical protein
MDQDPTQLDAHRGMAAQKATDERRERSDVAADQGARRERQEALEAQMLACPAGTWPELAEKVEFLLGLFAETGPGQDPRHRRLIEAVLADIARLRTGAADKG